LNIQYSFVMADFFDLLVDGEAVVIDDDESESSETESESSSLGGFVVGDGEQLDEESNDSETDIDEIRRKCELEHPRHKRKRLLVRESTRLFDDLRESSNIGTQVTSGMLTPAGDSSERNGDDDDVEDCRCSERIESVRLIRTVCQEVESEGATGVTGVLLEKYRASFALIREVLGSPCFAESSISANCSAKKRRRVGSLVEVEDTGK
jgi:hypothetical protein